jgi:uncharacterized protein YbjT (DUF2867 family)
LKHVLIVGASGFVGRNLAAALLAQGCSVRCVVRNPAKIEDLARAGCQTVQGDIVDAASMMRAMEGISAVYISIHTLSHQPANAAGQSFVDLELTGLRNVVAACKTQGTRRIIYVTSLGIERDATSAWTKGRWSAEQYLLGSGMNVTVIRPGQIVGKGGQGFDAMLGQARKSIAVILGSGRQRTRGIAIDDLVYYLTGALDEPRTYGETYAVGCDDVLTNDEMIDVTALLLGRNPPLKIHLKAGLLKLLAPLIERMAKLPKGAGIAALEAMQSDLDGDPTPIRAILPKTLIPYRDAVKRALRS